MQTLFDRMDLVPPHNKKAEQMILGNMLVDGESLKMGISSLKEEHFFMDAHKKIFSAIKKCSVNALWTQKDVVLELNNFQIISEFLTSDYLEYLANQGEDTSAVGSYIYLIIHDYYMRKAIGNVLMIMGGYDYSIEGGLCGKKFCEHMDRELGLEKVFDK